MGSTGVSIGTSLFSQSFPSNVSVISIWIPEFLTRNHSEFLIPSFRFAIENIANCRVGKFVFYTQNKTFMSKFARMKL